MGIVGSILYASIDVELNAVTMVTGNMLLRFIPYMVTAPGLTASFTLYQRKHHRSYTSSSTDFAQYARILLPKRLSIQVKNYDIPGMADMNAI